MLYIRCLFHLCLLMTLGVILSRILIRLLFLLIYCMNILMKSLVQFIKRFLGLRIVVYSNNGYIGHCRMFTYRLGQFHSFIRGWNNLRLIGIY